MSEICPNDIGEDFQELWKEKLSERQRLLADRSPSALQWHFEIPGDRGCARVLCCHQDGKLIGYAVIRSDTDQQTGLRKSVLADMVVRGDDEGVVRALWAAAYDCAKHVGSHVLEVLGFPPCIRRVFSEGNPYLRKYPSFPFYYKAADPLLHQTLSDGMAWYASPFDGDATLIRPSYSSAAKLGCLEVQIEKLGDNIVDVPQGERTQVF